MANSTQNDEITSSCNDSLLKRKAISEMRLKDPRLWDIVGWMKSMFVKDMESGVRKVDFYNYVTGHLGKIGYRDVWHILKIAYPHVDRVRRGRKYMYWGIRHVDDKLEHMSSSALNDGESVVCANTSGNENDGGGGDDEKDDEKDAEDSGSENKFKSGKSSRNSSAINNNNSMDNCDISNNSTTYNITNNKDNSGDNNKMSSSSSNHSSEFFNDDNNNNTVNENDTNNGIQNNKTTTNNNNDDIDKISNSDNNQSESTNNTNITRNDDMGKCDDDDASANATQSLNSHDKRGSPSATNSTSVVVKSEQFSDDEEETKPQDFLVMEFKEKDVFESFEDYEKSKGNVGKDGRSLSPPPTIFRDHPSSPSLEFSRKKNEMSNEDHGKQENKLFSSSLLKPENINKVCIPLIHDVKKQATKGEATKPMKTGFNPVIVSVESIGKERNPNLLNDDKLVNQSQDANDGELQTVVVQDRGIQVCENASGNNTQRKMRKRRQKEVDCSKGPCSNINEPVSRLAVSPLKPRKRARKTVDKSSTSTLSTSKPTVPLAPKPMTVNSTHQQRLSLTNVVKVPSLPLPPSSRGYTASTIGGSVSSPQDIALLTQALTNATNVNASAPAKMTSPTHLMTSRLSDGSLKRTDAPLNRVRHDHLLQYNINDHKNNNNNPSLTRSLHELTSRQNTAHNRPVSDQRSDYNRELIRKLLEEHESKMNSTANSKDSDLQVMVDCLSAEVEKERTMRLRLEIELRKVENQLDQERKLNERLAALLMKR